MGRRLAFVVLCVLALAALVATYVALAMAGMGDVMNHLAG